MQFMRITVLWVGEILTSYIFVSGRSDMGNIGWNQRLHEILRRCHFTIAWQVVPSLIRALTQYGGTRCSFNVDIIGSFGALVASSTVPCGGWAGGLVLHAIYVIRGWGFRNYCRFCVRIVAPTCSSDAFSADAGAVIENLLSDQPHWWFAESWFGFAVWIQRLISFLFETICHAT